MTVSERKEREKEQRRKAILDEAFELFVTHGYDNVSMNDIAEAAELSKGALYVYFSDKESLFLAIVLRGAGIMRDMFRGGVQKETIGIRKVEATGRAFFEFHRQYPDYYRLLHYAGSDRFDISCCAEGKEIMSLNEDVLAIMTEAIRTGIEDGTIREDVNPLEMAIFLSTASETVLHLPPPLQSALASQGVSYEDYVEHALGFMRHALSDGKARRSR